MKIKTDKEKCKDTDIKISALFDAYKPALADEVEFKTNLLEKIETLEIVRERHIKYARLNHRSALASCVAGFVTGSVLTYFYPYFQTLILNLLVLFPGIPEISLPEFSMVMSWTIIAGISFCITLATYTCCLTLKKMNV